MRKTLVSIIAVCVLTAVVGTSVFADTSLYKAYTFLHDYQTDQDMVGIYVTQHLTDPVLVNVSEYSINSGQQSHRYFTVKQDLDVVIKVTNRTTDVKFNMSRINLAVPLNSPIGSTGFTRIGYSQSSYTFDADNGIEVLYRGQLSHSSGAPTFLIHSGEDRFIFLGENQSITIHVSTTLYNTYFSTSNSVSTSTILKNLGYSLPSSLSDDNLTVDSIGITTINSVYNDSYNLHQIERHTQNILDAYTNNASNITDTNSQIDSTQSTVDYVHSQEQTWYAANQSAIEETGLSNARLSDNQYQGVYPVANDFNQLWVAIGPTKWIYLFTLMCSLAAFMLRHKPFSHAGAEIGYQSRSASRQERRLNK